MSEKNDTQSSVKSNSPERPFEEEIVRLFCPMSNEMEIFFRTIVILPGVSQTN